MAELRRAVYLSPYEAAAHLLIGRIHLRAGRPEDAIDALKISIWSEDSAAARIALAEAYLALRNTAAARTELQRALALDPSSSEARRLLDTSSHRPRCPADRRTEQRRSSVRVLSDAAGTRTASVLVHRLLASCEHGRASRHGRGTKQQAVRAAEAKA